MFELTPLIEKALCIAENQHRGQVDKCGVPYIFHPYNVAARCAYFYEHNRLQLYKDINKETLICLALLHDVVEDTNYTLDDFPQDFIRKAGFKSSIAALTHIKSESRKGYICGILNNECLYPLIVKLMDLKENMRLDRQCVDRGKQALRNQRYYEEYRAILIELCKRMINGVALDKNKIIQMDIDGVPIEIIVEELQKGDGNV